jgi:hypothetical protein
VADYANIIDGVVARTGSLPRGGAYLLDGVIQRVAPLRNASLEIQQACGWHAITDTPRPADTASHTFDASVVLVAGVPTRLWQTRPWTPAELAMRAAGANDLTIREQAEQALTTLQQQIDAAPVTFTTLAQAQTAMRQLQQAVQFQARVNRRLIRLILGKLDGTD